MTARKLKGSWWIDYRTAGKRYRIKSPVNTKRGAEEHERQLRQRLLDKGVGPKEVKSKRAEKSTETKVSAFAKEFLTTYARSNNKPSELETKRMVLNRHLLPFFGDATLDAIDGRIIEKYKAGKLESGLHPKTINNHLTVLNKMLNLAVEWQLLSHAPRIKWLKSPEPEFDFLDFEEAERLVAAVTGEMGAMIVIALKTGMRLGELLALRWGDVDLVAGKIMVRRAAARGIVGTPKSGKPREIPLSPEALRVLSEHRHLRGEIVFCAEDGKMRTKESTKCPLWSTCRRAGLRRIGWHMLRHSFASHLAMRGVPLKVVQELLGHATIEMTMRYAHLAPAIHRNAVAELDRPAKSGHQVGTKASQEGVSLVTNGNY